MLLKTGKGVLVWSDAVYVNFPGKIHIIHYSKLLQKVQVSSNSEINLSLCVNTVFLPQCFITEKHVNRVQLTSFYLSRRRKKKRLSERLFMCKSSVISVISVLGQLPAPSGFLTHSGGHCNTVYCTVIDCRGFRSQASGNC